MNWLLVYEIIYLLALVFVCLRVVHDTRSTTKTLAYLLFAIFVPFVGMIFYFFFGINYRSRKMYSKKLIENDDLAKRLK
ncbi:MAG TPA: PLDc N-terminal domain-containing protein, partial [Hanamia sp.]|nr:PLDc N-terminal domain-containing protein [Hanamia sp.]